MFVKTTSELVNVTTCRKSEMTALQSDWELQEQRRASLRSFVRGVRSVVFERGVRAWCSKISIISLFHVSIISLKLQECHSYSSYRKKITRKSMLDYMTKTRTPTLEHRYGRKDGLYILTPCPLQLVNKSTRRSCRDSHMRRQTTVHEEPSLRTDLWL